MAADLLGDGMVRLRHDVRPLGFQSPMSKAAVKRRFFYGGRSLSNVKGGLFIGHVPVATPGNIRAGAHADPTRELAGRCLLRGTWMETGQMKVLDFYYGCWTRAMGKKFPGGTGKFDSNLASLRPFFFFPPPPFCVDSLPNSRWGEWTWPNLRASSQSENRIARQYRGTRT